MRKLIVVLFTAFLSVPALAVAGSPPSPADSAAAQKQCRTELNAMGAAPFKLFYGGKSNAFGKCVSRRASQNAANRAEAAAECTSAKAADPTGFATKYGTGKNAFVRCVQQASKALAAAQVSATINASKQCSAELKANPTAFQAKYGPGTKSKAFGKCVSSKVKHSS